MKKLGRGTAIVIAVFLFLFILSLFCWRCGNSRYRRVMAGFAHPTFPYSDYSIAELEKMYPQYIENNAPTVQSPEETHQKFLAALKKGDFDEAVGCCFREGDRVGMKEGLQKISENGVLASMIKNLDTKLTIGQNQSINNGSSDVTYYYSASQDGKKIGSTINFIKSQDGIWYIESL